MAPFIASSRIGSTHLHGHKSGQELGISMSERGHTSMHICKTHQAAHVGCVCSTKGVTPHVCPGLGFADSFTAHLPRPPVCGASCSAAQTRLGGGALPALPGRPPPLCRPAVLRRAPAKTAQRRQGMWAPGHRSGPGGRQQVAKLLQRDLRNKGAAPGRRWRGTCCRQKGQFVQKDEVTCVQWGAFAAAGV